MALVNCKECNKEISNKAESCVNCGAPVYKENMQTYSKFKHIVLGFLYIVGAIVAVLSILNAIGVAYLLFVSKISVGVAIVGVLSNILTVALIRITRTIYRKSWSAGQRAIMILFYWINAIFLVYFVDISLSYNLISTDYLYLFGSWAFIDIILLIIMQLIKRR